MNLLLTAIAKARGWIDDIRLGRIASFAEIAEQEAVGEFIGTPRLSVTPHHSGDRRWHGGCGSYVTGLAKALPYSWAEQERKIGLHSQ
jgi:hypothetical protein